MNPSIQIGLNLTTAVALMFLAMGIAFVGWPFIRERAPAFPAAPDATAEELRIRRDRAYQALRELEYDERTGKISPQDRLNLRGRYETEALSALAALNSQERSTDDEIDHEIERLVAEARARTAPSTVQAAVAFCPRCGNAAAADDAFCRKCGAALAA